MTIPRIVAVGFGTPPCIDEVIADALLLDELMVTVVHRDDVVPRLSRTNIQQLAIEVNNFTEDSTRFQKEDQKSLEQYAKTYGLAGDMGEHEVKQGVTEEEKAVTVTKSSTLPPQSLPPVENLKIVEVDQPLVVPGKIIHLTFSNGR